MGCSLIVSTEPCLEEVGQPWEGGVFAWPPAPICAEADMDEDDPFDDFDEDDFDDDFDDDFEEDWEDDLTEDNEFPDTFGGQDDDVNPASPKKNSPFNDDPDFDD